MTHELFHTLKVNSPNKFLGLATAQDRRIITASVLGS